MIRSKQGGLGTHAKESETLEPIRGVLVPALARAPALLGARPGRHPIPPMLASRGAHPPACPCGALLARLHHHQSFSHKVVDVLRFLGSERCTSSCWRQAAVATKEMRVGRQMQKLVGGDVGTRVEHTSSRYEEVSGSSCFASMRGVEPCRNKVYLH